jgi:hypothetical protein
MKCLLFLFFLFIIVRFSAGTKGYVVSRLFWVSSLAYPNLLGTKGYVVVVVVVVVVRFSAGDVIPIAVSVSAGQFLAIQRIP